MPHSISILIFSISSVASAVYAASRLLLPDPAIAQMHEQYIVAAIWFEKALGKFRIMKCMRNICESFGQVLYHEMLLAQIQAGYRAPVTF